MLLNYPRILKYFYLIYSFGNEDALSTEPVLNNTHETDETVSQVCNNLNENMFPVDTGPKLNVHKTRNLLPVSTGLGSPFSKVKNYKLQNPKISQ